MTMAELDQMLDMGRRTETPSGARDHALVLVAARSGWGVSKLTQLMISDLGVELEPQEVVDRKEVRRDSWMVWVDPDRGQEWWRSQQGKRRREWLAIGDHWGRRSEEKTLKRRQLTDRWIEEDQPWLADEVVLRVQYVVHRWTRRYAVIRDVSLDSFAAASLWRWLRFRNTRVGDEGHLFCTISSGQATGHGIGELVPGTPLNPSQVYKAISTMGVKANLGRVTLADVRAVQVVDRNRNQERRRWEDERPKEDQFLEWILSRTRPGGPPYWSEPEIVRWREWEFADADGTPVPYPGPLHAITPKHIERRL